jgi:hypothetical protein
VVTGAGAGSDGEVEGAFVRPFLDRPGPVPARPSAVPPPAAPPGDGGAEAGAVRPYYQTGGRVGSTDGRVRIETMVLARAGAAARLPAHAWEQHRLLALAVRPISVAELSAAMGVAVGVALVLVDDLARDGMVDLSTATVAPKDDVALIRRLIDGVIAL